MTDNPVKDFRKVNGRRCRRCRGRKVVPVKEGRGVEPCLRCDGTGLHPERLRVFIEAPDAWELVVAIEMRLKVHDQAREMTTDLGVEPVFDHATTGKLLRALEAVTAAISRHDGRNS